MLISRWGAVVAGAVALWGGTLPAQGVQAAMNIADQGEPAESALEDRAQVLAQAREDFGGMQGTPAVLQEFDADAADDAGDWRREMDDALDEMARDLDHPLRFERALSRYNQAVVGYNQTLASFRTQNATAAQRLEAPAGPDPLRQVRILATGNPPAAHTLVDRVAFSVGYFMNAADGRHPAHDAAVSTNLLGAALGTAFGALGNPQLSGYLERNVVMGAGLSIADENKISGAFGLGLGGVQVRSWSLWPVLNIEQVDTTDGRVPADVRQLRPTEGTWSNVALSVGIVPYSQKTFTDRVAAGRAAPVLVVGLSLPVYYPGDPAATLAAMFTDNRRRFERSGKLGLLMGVSIPLLRLDKATGTGGR